MSSRVARAVRLTLPTSASTSVLRAALWEGDDGYEAFTRWAAQVGDPRALPQDRRPPLRELAPQLEMARQWHKAQTPGALGVLLRAAADHERRRWATYRDAAVELLGDEAEPLISGGLAIALAAYAEPALRHCHDLDRLGPEPTTATHPSGLPTVVHAGRLPAAWRAEDDLEAVRARSVPDDRLGRLVCRTSVGDLLVTVLVHGVAGRRIGSVRWAADAWFLARVAVDADWQVLTSAVADHRLGPVVHPLLRYVADDLRGEVPPAVVDEVASAPGPDDDHVALAVAWARRRRQRRPRAGRAASWARSRAAAVRRRVRP